MSRGTAAKAAGIIAAAGLVGWAFESNEAGVGGNGAAQARFCQGTRQVAERAPDELRDGVRQAAEQTCENGVNEAPPMTRVAVSAPGPDAVVGSELDAAGRRYVKTVTSRLPRDGVVTVGGVKLPTGSRRLGYWATDAPTQDAVALADRLAKAFPRTGLWPVLWDWEDTPDSYAYPSAPEAADGVDVRAALNRVWRSYFEGAGLDALARGSEQPARRPDAPFAQLAEAGGLTAENGAAILLVPVRRPADVVAALGTAETEVAPVADLTATARSWEDRFGAVVTQASPGGFSFSIGSPAKGAQRTQALAAEQIAFAPEGDTADVDEQGRALRHLARDGNTGRQAWFFGWPD